MRHIPTIYTLWPGLPQLWVHGQWYGLAKAVGFAALLNFALLATFWQPDLVSKNLVVGVWALIGITWVFSFLNDGQSAGKKRNRATNKKSDEADKLFLEAQSEYLGGHLDEAETLFERLIWLNSRDLDSRMYLATIHRHRGRINQAEHQLDLMERFDEGVKWQHQILDERKLISELEKELAAESDDDNELHEMSSSEMEFDKTQFEEVATNSDLISANRETEEAHIGEISSTGVKKTTDNNSGSTSEDPDKTKRPGEKPDELAKANDELTGKKRSAA